MNILIVNDDGIDANGLHILTKAASHFGNVFVSAPKVQQSAKSAAITYYGTIEIEEIEPLFGSIRTIVVDGSPVDCVRAGVKVFETEFDLVLSGINHGVNLATDIQYSGTVAAAFEASIMGYHAIAFSASNINLPYIYDETAKLLDEIIENEVYNDTDILNINFPHQSFKKVIGTRITTMGNRIQHSEYIKTDKPNIYRIIGSNIIFQENEDSDMNAHNSGYVSITPLRFNRTDESKITKLFKE
ncbi:5'/3'-nucleotidase SurE [Acholeplasma granularum]|uniref:5'/3'-nucleotidase SurE n=1 Tax=Acholeplasma granularum TaxID=264635 RepID=UPI0004705727|nr:5'/3'-nucleotidase SurE [Acholeplasma granularum]